MQIGLRPDASKHHIRVCACLATQFDFFRHTDSDVLLAAINVQVSASSLSINQSAKNVARNDSTLLQSIVSSRRSDPINCLGMNVVNPMEHVWYP